MKTQVQFDTYPVNTELDPAGGYFMRLKELQIVNDDSVFEEVVKEKTLPFSPELLEFSFRAILATMALKVSKDCRPRKIGNYLKATPYLRGKLKGPYSAYDPETCSCAIVFTSLSGLDKTVNTTEYVQFVNVKTGTKVTINHITYEGSMSEAGVGKIMIGKGIVVTGLNCQWLDGDTCTLAWTDASGSPHTASITPTSSSVTEMRFAWPTALNELAEGTEVAFHFETRGGIEDSEPQPNDKTVMVLANPEPTPSLTKVQQGNRAEGTAGFGQGAAAAITLTGTIPGGKQTGDALRLDCLNDGAVYATMDATSYITASTETTLTLGNGIDNDSAKPDTDWQNKTAKFTLVRDGVEYPVSFTFVNA